ncbi:MAG: hypothetical protein GQ540_08995 [Lutibacter sp.]|uniref:ligand-binding sensor domain-containing protein n=1 Tax=Lutibacter sp. TaxID=1925666 RepID=UPI0019F47C64|nr:two-component regulator propeller domain-containing protein [Lutibacter sp.]NOR28647.1 hypothetical protein [Lutibacter sp.]
MRRIFILIVISYLFQASLLAQIPGLTTFTIDNGLPSNTIYDTAQDENGFMWFATDYGVSKFDGLTFNNFTINDGLPGNEILKLYKDSKNRIWMSAFNGNVGFIKNGKIHNKNNTPYLKKINASTFVYDIFEDSKNQIWFYQNMNNIKVLKTNLNIQNYSLDANVNVKKTSLILEDVHEKVRLLTYFIKNKKPFIISKTISDNFKKKEWENYNPKQFNQNAINKINNNLGVLLRDKDDIIKKISNSIINEQNNYLSKTYKVGKNYWVTNLNKGILIFNEANNYNSPKKTLKDVQTNRAYIDSEKNIWIGSQSNGVFLFPNLHINGIQFDDSKMNDLHSLNLFNNNIILGTEHGEIIQLDTKTLQVKNIIETGTYSKRIRKINYDENSLLILGDYNIHKLDRALKIKKVKNMYDVDFRKAGLRNFKDVTFTNEFIVTANANGVAKINKKTNITTRLWNKRSTSILFDNNKKLWIGTTIGLFHKNNDTIEKYNLNEQFNNSIIYALENSSQGLLIGSNSYGFGILKNKEFKTYNTEDGLLSNYIKSIFVDSTHKIWLSTNFGLNCIDLNENNELITVKSYTTSDGLYSNDVRASYVKENKVYVATSKGLNIIDLTEESNSILTPSVHMNEILLNNNSIDKSSGQTFNNQLNNIQFNFSGISFKSLGNISFKYRLKGLEKDWISTKTTTIRYSSLPPNNYTFEFKAISKNKLESVPYKFMFTIKPPIHKTWWFISSYIFIIVVITTFLLYQRSRKIKHKQKTKEQISNLRYQALNAQMNPHFINNLLVNINALADKGVLKEVKGSLDKFAELVNLILNSTKCNLISLSDEIKMVELYLELQKLRFNKNISYSINTKLISEDELEGILVPPMILQPIIENSFKHGFKNGDKENSIQVNFKIEGSEFLICEISDNGIGIKNNSNNLPKSKSSGISFSNINERLQLIKESESDEKLVLISNITDEFNTLVGLKITLKIPLISF